MGEEGFPGGAAGCVGFGTSGAVGTSAEAALDVEFTTGRVYRYFAVPEPVARGLAESRSKGVYFNKAIRDRFGYERLGGWEAPPPDETVAA